MAQDGSVDQVPGEAERQRRRGEREQRPPSWCERIGEHQACPYGKDGESDCEPHDVPPSPGGDSDRGGLDENDYADAGSVAEVAPKVAGEIVRARARCPPAYPAEEISPQVENIDIGQPEAIIACARYQSPREAGESCLVDAIPFDYHQNSEEPEQRKKEEIADDAKGDNAKYLT